MSDNASTASKNASSLTRPRALEAILYGGLVVGVLDGLDAVIFFGLRNGVKPIGIFQSIASGLLGRDAFNGGQKTAILGVFLHFLIAFILATIYYLATLELPTLIRRPVLWGIIYGVVAYFEMNYVVIPLSAAGRSRFALAVLLNGVVGHALLVGLPIALIVRRSTRA